MIPSELVNFFSGISKSAGLDPNIIVFILLFLLLLFITTSVILLKLRSADRVLSAAEREMDSFAQRLEHPSRGVTSTQIHLNTGQSDPVLDEIADHPEQDEDTDSEENLSSLTNDSDLKEKIHDLILATDKSISLKYLVKQLYEKNFDGNYHPILNELDRLEREGEIEGQVINGKVFFRKKPKTPRKYILRKGKNFRKYMG